MSNYRIEYIDFAKGFAILSIVLFHYFDSSVSGIMSKAIMFGGAGVHLFFLLSGFGLGLSSQQIIASTFYRKRFIKIYIPYCLVVILVFLFNTALGLSHKADFYALGGHIFLYKMFDERIIGSFGYHFWFLSTIIQFYLFFPIIIKFKKSLTNCSFLVTMTILSVAFWFISSLTGFNEYRVVNSFFLQYIWEFCLGIVLADMYKKTNFRFWDINVALLWWTFIIGVGMTGILSIKGGRTGKSFNDFFSLMGFFSLSVLCYSFLNNYLQLGKKFILFIGKISYELYLFHIFVFSVISKLLLPTISVDNNIGYICLVILPSAIVFSLMYSIFLHRTIFRN